MDAHQHFWIFDEAGYGWIDPGSVLAANHLPAHLAAPLAQADMDFTIAVQARQDVAETEWLLALAQDAPWIAGVIGWVDLTRPDLVALLPARDPQGRLVGFRHVVQAEPDGFLAREDVRRSVATLIAKGYAYDILVFARQAGQVPAFVQAIGSGRGLVLDHCGKPDIAGGAWEGWARDIAAVAASPEVACKLSGLVTEADHRAWTRDQIRPYLDHVLRCFGPDRLMFGSDWPVCRLAADYRSTVDLIEGFVAERCPGYREAIFGGNAARVYALPL